MSQNQKGGMVSQLRNNKNYLFIAVLMFISCKTTLNTNQSISPSTKNSVERDEKVPVSNQATSLSRKKACNELLFK